MMTTGVIWPYFCLPPPPGAGDGKQNSRCSFSMMIKRANDGKMLVNDGEMLVNDGEMLVNDGEMSI